MKFGDLRPEPGKWSSIILAAFVHGLLAVFLIYGIRWQSKAPASVEVDLYRSLPPVAAPKVEPAPEARPEPRPEPKPEPKSEPKPEPKPQPKPEPKPEPKPVPPPKPDIALKEKEKPKPREEPPKPREEPKPKASPEPDRMQELLRGETQRLEKNREAERVSDELAQLAAKQSAAAQNRARGTWIDKIRAKIRGNITVPPGAKGNPEAEFDVALLPDGSVLSLKVRRSTGNLALDAAIERAITKSSPLPKPDDPAVFERELHLKFRPLEE